MFSFEDCCFAIQKSKEACGRIVMWKEFNLINSFTLESSFMGPNRGVHQGTHFNSTMLKEVGRAFCETLVRYQRDSESVQKVMNELKVRYPQGGTSGALAADFFLEKIQSKESPPASSHSQQEEKKEQDQ
jgi:hypothetical protein